MLTSDVTIIGGGVAGAAAALAATQAGARTVLIRRGPGATALSYGGWIGQPPQPLADALAGVGYTLASCDGLLPHPDGYLARCDLAPPSHAAAAINTGAELALICGIAGLPSFHAHALAALWSDDAGLSAHELEPVTLTIDGTPAAGWAPASLAAALERDPHRLTAPLAHAVREHGAARAIVPAVLGIDGYHELHAAMQHGAGVLVGEALGVAPSLPGWRLDRALLRALEAAGVTIVTGTVFEHAARNGSLSAVTVQGVDTASVSAHAFVLATGKFIGGGIIAETTFEETALGCALYVERFGRVLDDVGAALILTDPARTEPQPILGIGVMTDGDSRPTVAGGDPRFDNVFVAGAVRAGTETGSLGLGTAALDGWAAGTRAAASASTAGR